MDAGTEPGRIPQEGRAARGARPWRAYLILVLLVVTVASLGYARLVGKRAAALNAENKTKIQWVTAFLAKSATTDAGRARSAILQQNLGSAQDALRRAEEAVDALDRVALKADRSTVSSCREALERAQDALRQGNEADAEKAIDDLIRALGPLAAE
jgi:hypothetical protein